MDGQEFSEGVRADAKHNLRRYARSVDTFKLARTVDEQALEKCMVTQYGEYENNLARSIGEDMDDIEKARSRYGSGYRPSEVPLNIPFEKIYFDNLGRGMNGAMPDKIGTVPRCSGCGMQFATSMKLIPEKCPCCGRLTPRGVLNKEAPGWYKRL